MCDSSESAERDEHFLRLSFEVAKRARGHDNHPFGAVLVDRNGNVILESENAYMPTGDGTAHAERLLATDSCLMLAPDVRMHAIIRGALRDVRRRHLLGRNRTGRVRTERGEVAGGHRQSS